jgi:hypothetical protein
VCTMQTEEEKQVKVGFVRLIGMNKTEWPYLFVGVLASGALGSVMPLCGSNPSRCSSSCPRVAEGCASSRLQPHKHGVAQMSCN